MLGESIEEPEEELARLAQETIESQTGGVDEDEDEIETASSARYRCERVLALHNQGFIQSARDNFHASLVLLYGERPSHYQLSRDLAHEASKQGESRAWTLEAMAWDRWLLSMGKPQRFGTQIIKQSGRWSLSNVDPKTTDDERAMYGVPPLFVQEQRVKYLQREDDRDI